MCNLFLLFNDIDFANYADDNTPFVSDNTPTKDVESLRDVSIKRFEWLSNKQMNANPDKWHPVTSSTTATSITIKGHETLNVKTYYVWHLTINLILIHI